MDYIEREQWIEVCQMFFDAYVKFQIDGTEAHWYGCNYRNIEIAFIDCGYFVKVQLYCPEVLRILNGDYGRSAKNTEEIIRMLYWLAWEAEKRNSYIIKTVNPNAASPVISPFKLIYLSERGKLPAICTI